MRKFEEQKEEHKRVTDLFSFQAVLKFHAYKIFLCIWTFDWFCKFSVPIAKSGSFSEVK